MPVFHASDPQLSSTGGKIHPAPDYIVANASALTALTLSSTDLYKFAYQSDIGALMLLTSIGPPVWKQIPLSSAALSAYGTVGAVATDLTDAVNELAALSDQNAQVFSLVPTGTLSTFAITGFGTVFGVNTASQPTVADTDYASRRLRIRYTSPASAGNGAGLQAVVNGTGICSRNTGFEWFGMFGIVTASANGRAFMGLTGTSAPAGDPQAAINTIGIGWNASGNLQLWSNDNAGTATLIKDLGANFPAKTAAVYHLWLKFAPGGGTVYWRCRRFDVPQMDSGSFTSDLPVAGALMWPAIFQNNNADATSIVTDIYGVNVYIPF